MLKVYQMLCAIWHHLYNLTNIKSIHGGMSLVVNLQAYFTKSNTPPRVFFTFLKLYEWYQIAQRITWKLTASDKVNLNTVLKNKRLCCVNNTPKAINPFLTTQTKTWTCQCFFFRLSQNAILECLSLNCCRFFKIYTSYIISKFRSVKMINTSWFLVPYF